AGLLAQEFKHSENDLLNVAAWSIAQTQTLAASLYWHSRRSSRSWASYRSAGAHLHGVSLNRTIAAQFVSSQALDTTTGLSFLTSPTYQVPDSMQHTRHNRRRKSLDSSN